MVTPKMKMVARFALPLVLACVGCSVNTPSAPPNVAPTITTQPTGILAIVGSIVTLTAAATGNPTPTYQWNKNGTSVAGATSTSYVTPALLASDTGSSFTFSATNSAGSVNSAPAIVTILLPPTIIAQPANTAALIGDNATFSVTANSIATPTYQWSKGGTPLSGATGATYTTPTLVAADSGTVFSVKITNAAGTVTSNNSTLTVTPKPATIAANPANVTVTDGSTATFSVTAAGTAPFTYQWLRGASPIAGATGASYTIATTQITDDGALFSVSVSNAAATVASSAAKLSVNPLPVTITAQPSSTSRFAGEKAGFSVTAAGTQPTYQWRANAASIPGATSSSFVTPILTAADDKTVYDVVVTNAAGSATSAAATLRVGPFATTYTTQKGIVLNMFAWSGNKNAFLTKTSNLDPVSMRKILNAADGTWNYYAATNGQLPSIIFNYNGLATIANTGVGGIDLCGDGCTFIGATGMELSDNAFNWLYNGVTNDLYDQVMFYEFGRSFWVFNNQIGYKNGANATCETTGYAVLMRYRSITAQGLTGTFFASVSNYNNQYNNTLGMIDTYANNANLTFNNTFLVDSFSSPYGGCADLWTSMMIRLAANYGGEAFIQSVFKAALARPAAVTTQDAIDNFVLAASTAAGKNLTYTFGTTWRWPISTSASQEAQLKYGNPQ